MESLQDLLILFKIAYFVMSNYCVKLFSNSNYCVKLFSNSSFLSSFHLNFKKLIPVSRSLRISLLSAILNVKFACYWVMGRLIHIT